jgi:hypothetical protein
MIAKAGSVERSAAVVGALLPIALVAVLLFVPLAGEVVGDVTEGADDEPVAGAGVAAEAETGVPADGAYAAIN